MTQTVLIPDGEKLYSFYVIYCLKKACRNLKFIVWSDKFYTNPPYSKYISECRRPPARHDMDSYYERLLDMIRTENVDLLLPCTTDGIEFILHHREDLEKECALIALPPLQTFDLVSDKWALHQTLAAGGIPTPASALFRDAEQLKDARYPVMLKPTHGESGVNIRKLDRMPDQALIETLQNAGEDFIIQQFIDGCDIDCSILASEGRILAHTIQMNIGDKSRFNPGNDKIKFVRDDRLLETVRKTSELLSWTGVAHIDLIRDARGTYQIIDFNPRFWGSILGSYSAGVNFPFLLYQLTLNLDFECPDFRETFFVSLRQFVKDARARSLDYGLRETNLKFILADPVFSLRKFLRWN